MVPPVGEEGDWAIFFSLIYPVAFIQVQATEPPVASFAVGGENIEAPFAPQKSTFDITSCISRRLERMPLHYTHAFVNRIQGTTFTYCMVKQLLS
jgi:hypothetical protein